MSGTIITGPSDAEVGPAGSGEPVRHCPGELAPQSSREELCLRACERIPDGLLANRFVQRFIFGMLRRRCSPGDGLRSLVLANYLNEMAEEARAAGMGWEEWT